MSLSLPDSSPDQASSPVELSAAVSVQQLIARANGPSLGALDAPEMRLADASLSARNPLIDGAIDSCDRVVEMTASLVVDLRAASITPAVSVLCLGAFQLLVRGTRVEGWRSGKALALFRYLVNHRNRPVPREALIRALWPDPDALAAGTSLKVAVHALRQMLNQIDGERLPIAVESHESSYQLSVSGLWLDVEEFERCVTLGRRLEAQARSSEALAQYARAAEMYGGDFLEESWEDWAVFRREGVKDQYLFVLARLADAALAAGDYQSCILRCQQLLEKDNCREDTYRTLLLCHARLGQRGRVRRWYELCVRALRAELDVAPEPETELLYRRALSRLD